MDTLSDRAETELARMIERRSRKVDPDEREEAWKRSVEAFSARRHEENRQAWAAFHEGQAERHHRTLQDLIARHEAEVEKYTDEHRGEGVT